MHVLEFDENGFPKYWIDENDPIHSYSLWKRTNKNESVLVRDIPAEFRKEFDRLKKG